MKAVVLKITGDVQGVNYRYWAKKTADQLGVMGWAKNEHDGTVTILAEAEEEVLNKYIAWAKEGSPMSTVSGVSVEEAGVTEIKGFEVK